MFEDEFAALGQWGEENMSSGARGLEEGNREATQAKGANAIPSDSFTENTTLGLSSDAPIDFTSDIEVLQSAGAFGAVVDNTPPVNLTSYVQPLSSAGNTAIINSTPPTNPIETPEQVICTICQKGYKSIRSLKSHRYQKHALRPWKCQAENCQSAFQLEEGLVRHIESSHPEASLSAAAWQVCPVPECGEQFSGEQMNRMRRHLREKHGWRAGTAAAEYGIFSELEGGDSTAGVGQRLATTPDVGWKSSAADAVNTTSPHQGQHDLIMNGQEHSDPMLPLLETQMSTNSIVDLTAEDLGSSRTSSVLDAAYTAPLPLLAAPSNIHVQERTQYKCNQCNISFHFEAHQALHLDAHIRAAGLVRISPAPIITALSFKSIRYAVISILAIPSLLAVKIGAPWHRTGNRVLSRSN